MKAHQMSRPFSRAVPAGIARNRYATCTPIQQMKAEPRGNNAFTYPSVSGVIISAAVAVALVASGPAFAISGGKGGTSGSYTPLDDADLSSQNLKDRSFTKGSLRRANFDNSDVSGVSFFGALCKQCSFVGATMRCAQSANYINAAFNLLP